MEYYSAMKRKGLSYATLWMNLTTWRYVKEARHKKTNTMWFYLDKVPRVVKRIEAESRMVAARVWCQREKREWVFLVLRATPLAYGGSQARGQMGAAAASLPHSHSNAGPEPHLWPIPQLTAMPNPPPTEWGQGGNPHPPGYQEDLFPLCYNRSSWESFLNRHRGSVWEDEKILEINCMTVNKLNTTGLYTQELPGGWSVSCHAFYHHSKFC